MANPRIPNISEQDQHLLYEKLNTYNLKKASYKEAGCYLIVLPHSNNPLFSLWFYTPSLDKQSFLFIEDLTSDITSSLRIVTTQLWYANRCIFITDYNDKRMSTRGEDLIPFGKYRGHYLYEIAKIDPGYINWIACKFIFHTPKEERFTKIAQVYNLIYIDKNIKKKKVEQTISQYLGQIGDKLSNLTLKIIRIKLEDDPYKTRMDLTSPLFFVRQHLTTIDSKGNLVNITVPSHYPSRISGQLSSSEHAFQIGDFIYITSARIAAIYESKNIRYTRLNYVKFNK
ncbi:MAG: hypothetical protein E7085_02685 [Parabacteroides distasonis]|nr:hypothetical protein [Parabacteroides distasonis]